MIALSDIWRSNGVINFKKDDADLFLYVLPMFLNAFYALLKAAEAVYWWDLFLRGKNGGIVRNRGFPLDYRLKISHGIPNGIRSHRQFSAKICSVRFSQDTYQKYIMIVIRCGPIHGFGNTTTSTDLCLHGVSFLMQLPLHFHTKLTCSFASVVWRVCQQGS